MRTAGCAAVGKIVVVGAGKKAEHLCDLFNLWSNLLQFYDEPRELDETKHGIPVLNHIHLYDDKTFLTVYSAIGDTRPKRIQVKRFEEEANERGIRYRWGELMHGTSIITNLEQLGPDFIIRELSSIGTRVKIGSHVSIGPLANVSHHSVVGDYSTICGQAAIGGSVTIGEGVFIGQGAVAKPDVKIGSGSVVGAGAVVVKDVPPNTVVAGNPASINPKFKVLEEW